MKTTLICVITALLALAGCRSTVNTIEPEEKIMTPNTVTDMRFVTDSALSRRLFLTKIDTAYTEDSFLRAQLEAVNTGKKPYKVRYKFTWFNVDGMTVDTVLSDWKTISVLPGETVFIRSVAPSRECADFKISLIEAK